MIPRRTGRVPGPALATAAAAAFILGPGHPAVDGSERPNATDSVASGRLLFHEVAMGGEPHRYAVYLPPGYDVSRPWPAIVFLHGSGECGTDGEKPTRIGLLPAVRSHPERWPFVIAVPQKPVEDEEWDEREDLVLAVLRDVRSRCSIDSTRIALSGISQGGAGAWRLGARHPGLWSCLVPVCGYGRPLTVGRRVATLSVWAFHGLKDDIVDPRETQKLVAAIRSQRAARGLDSLAVRMTLYPEANHGSWEQAYAEPELPRWILEQRRRTADKSERR